MSDEQGIAQFGSHSPVARGGRDIGDQKHGLSIAYAFLQVLGSMVLTDLRKPSPLIAIVGL